VEDMKRIYLGIIVLVLLLTMTTCEQKLMSYEGVEGVYFAVQHGSSWGVERTWPYQPYTDVEFVKIPENETTIQIKVMITGMFKNYDRPFKVEINPDSTTAQLGIHYEPLPEGLFIPANATTAYVPVTLKRTPDLQTEMKSIGLRLVANEYFELSFPEWDAVPGFTAGTIVSKFDAGLHTVNINDFMVQPAVWIGSIQAGGREAGNWGAFSRKKLELMCKLFNLTYADFGSTATMPSVLSGLIAREVSNYLIAKYEAGEPVLEDDGRLMFLGYCPWTSYVGIPWVPEP
jgi:hypothetical protein